MTRPGRAARIQGRVHLALMVFWTLLVIPALLFWSRSVAFLIVVSLYANAVTHWGALQASRAVEKVEGLS